MFITNLYYLYIMKEKKNTLTAIWQLYRDGFRNMTWGKPLWGLIILKAIILFAILRVFFFQPAMKGLTEEEKSEQVGNRLVKRNTNDTLTIE